VEAKLGWFDFDGHCWILLSRNCSVRGYDAGTEVSYANVKGVELGAMMLETCRRTWSLMIAWVKGLRRNKD
jgi:hypothetical protein